MQCRPRKSSCSSISKLLYMGLMLFAAPVSSVPVTWRKPGGTLELTTCGNTVIFQGPFTLTVENNGRDCAMGTGQILDQCSGNISEGAPLVTPGFLNKNSTKMIPVGKHSLRPGVQSVYSGLKCDQDKELILLKRVFFRVKKSIPQSWICFTGDGKLINLNSGKVLARLKEGVDFVIESPSQRKRFEL